MKKIILILLCFLPLVALGQSYNTNFLKTAKAVYVMHGSDTVYFPPPVVDQFNFGSELIDDVPNVQINAALTDDTPTKAEINAATGLTPATAGVGYHKTIKDTTGSGLLYMIESDGTNWFYYKMTKAS